MNRDLLEALAAVATDYYLDAMSRHAGLFTMTGVTTTTDDDRRVAPVLWTIDQLLLEIECALGPPRTARRPVAPPDDDDIPF